MLRKSGGRNTGGTVVGEGKGFVARGTADVFGAYEALAGDFEQGAADWIGQGAAELSQCEQAGFTRYALELGVFREGGAAASTLAPARETPPLVKERERPQLLFGVRQSNLLGDGAHEVVTRGAVVGKVVCDAVNDRVEQLASE